MADLTSGELQIAAGDDPDDPAVIATIDLATADNAAGNSDTPYLDPRLPEQMNPRSKDFIPIPEKPGDQGVPVAYPPRWTSGLFRGAHRGPGELLYFIVRPTDSDYELDTSTFVLRYKEEIVNVRTGRRTTKIHTVDGNREKSVAEGGIEDDPTAKQNRANAVLARPALGPGKIGRGSGRFQFSAKGTAI